VSHKRGGWGADLPHHRRQALPGKIERGRWWLRQTARRRGGAGGGEEALTTPLTQPPVYSSPLAKAFCTRPGPLLPRRTPVGKLIMLSTPAC
jgi:hypothetical protein